MPAPVARSLFIAGSALALVSVAVPCQSSTAPLASSNAHWQLDPRSAQIGERLGQQALLVRGQAPPAFAAGMEFTDGTIEFDLAPMPGGNFLGLVFRYVSPTEHENIYFRLHRSGSFEAVQYAPRLFTTAGIWQLLPEFMAPAQFMTDRWLHVRVEVRGSRLEVFAGEATKPIIVVPRMRGLTTKGLVGFWGRVNDRPEEWAAALANIQIRPRPAVPLAGPDTTTLPNGSLTDWRAAGPYLANDSSVAPPFPADGEWKPIPIEESGLVNISRHVAKPPGGRHVVFLRNVIHSANRGQVPMELAYSEDVMIWVNRQPVYRGTNAFNGRYPGYLGLMVPAEVAYLPLQQGENEIIVAVGERAFGWGLKARLMR
jgi:hypothetical protein